MTLRSFDAMDVSPGSMLTVKWGVRRY